MGQGIGDFLASSLEGGFVPWAAEREAARRYGMGARAVEGAALAQGFLPARYARNAGSLGLEGQKALHEARVLVAGCGGLGGHLIEGLARLGVGHIVAVDPDSFDESNLNRQLLCSTENLGKPKADEAARRVALINPAAAVLPLRERIGPENADALLAGVHIAMDGLDGVSARIALSEACARGGITLVHAAVAGWYGQASTQAGGKASGTASVARLYALAAGSADRGDEQRLGNQAYGPAFAAAIQLAEACKIICGKSPALENRLYTYDLLAMTSASFDLS
jgi:molybdopterin/thiamine biosynthesis adenylyltransferase